MTWLLVVYTLGQAATGNLAMHEFDSEESCRLAGFAAIAVSEAFAIDSVKENWELNETLGYYTHRFPATDAVRTHGRFACVTIR